MSRNIIVSLIILLLLGGSVGLYHWAVVRNHVITPPPATGQVVLGATIFPLADLARQIGGQYVQVQLLIPPGVSEHSNALTPQQLQTMDQVPILLQIGHGLDDKLTARVQAAFPNIKLVTVDRGIMLRQFSTTGATVDAEDTGVDPHYWLTVPNAIKIASVILDQLQQIDPSHAAIYQTNHNNLVRDLQSLETDLQAQAQAMPRKQFISMHNAWSYLADNYGLQLVTTYEPIEGHDPSLQDLQHLKQMVQQYHLTTFYSEPQKASTSATRLLHEDLGLDIKVLDPVGGLPGRDSYQTLMKYNFAQLTAGAQ